MSLRYLSLLGLLVPVFLLAFAAFVPRRASPLSPLARSRAVARTWRSFLWWLPELFALAGLALSVFLLAGPERALEPLKEEGEGLNIAIVLDRSGSMQAIVPHAGAQARRIDAVKDLTRRFIQDRVRDAFSLVSFARYPETHTPLTTSRQIVVDFLDLVEIPVREEEDGTAIGDALVLALAHLPRAPGNLVILLTDGQSNQGVKTPLEAAGVARELGVPVYTIALGGEGYIMADTVFGKQAMPTGVDIDEATLREIANVSGGRYYRADSVEVLSSFYKDIATRETTRLAGFRAVKRELVLSPGIGVLLVLLSALVLVRTLVLRRLDA